MILRDRKLLKVSDGVFQEVGPPEDRSRPLEWRRNINHINLPLKNIKIVTGCNVHETDIDWEDEKSEKPLKLVKADISEQLAIRGIVDDNQMRDHIYFAVEDEGKENIFSVEDASGDTNISIKVGSPTDETNTMPKGLYRGSAFRMNFKPGEDEIYFELTIPRDQLLSLISALRADSNSSIEICTSLLSFTYEVDDALREHYHPRDLIINETTPCFLSWINVISKIGQHFLKTDSEYNYEEVEDGDIFKKELTPEQKSKQDLLKILQSYLQPLNRLATAIWVLIIVIILYAIFK